jgi:uncharacterized protein (UPF0335 family)
MGQRTGEDAERSEREVEHLQARIKLAKHQAKADGLSAKSRLQTLEFACVPAVHSSPYTDAQVCSEQEQIEGLARLRAHIMEKLENEKREIVRWRQDVSSVFVNLHRHAELN